MVADEGIVVDYGEVFYQRAIDQEGVDYNFYGDWQVSYAKMVIAITNIIKAASDEQDSLCLDIGCACGVTLRAFKETKAFGRYLGVDISEYLINMGMGTHGFTKDEMKIMDITKEPLPCDDDSVTLINCTHMLEHIPKDKLQFVLDEMYRVLKPEVGFGFVIVPAIKPGNPKSEVQREQTHFIIETMNWWRARFAKKFKVDNEVRKRFRISKHGPLNDGSTFYEHYNKGWTIYGLRKEK